MSTEAERLDCHDRVLLERNRALEERNRELRQTVLRLRRLAFVDSLTELANRRCFDHVLRAELRRGSRSGASLSLVLCDLDHFKRLNDELGHHAGDAALRSVASVLRAHCRRGGDLAARYGGEEFALLLPATPFRDGLAIAESIRRTIESLPCRAGVSAGRRLTVSLGVTTSRSPDACTASDLVGAADAALYAAKLAGRNRTRGEPV